MCVCVCVKSMSVFVCVKSRTLQMFVIGVRDESNFFKTRSAACSFKYGVRWDFYRGCPPLMGVPSGCSPLLPMQFGDSETRPTQCGG